MGVYQRGESWYMEFHYDGKRYRESIGPVNKTVAGEKLTIRKREVIQGTWKPKRIQILFDKFSEEYLKHARTIKRPSSAQRDENSLKHLRPVFGGGKRLSDISPILVERYKAMRKNEGAKAMTINNELGCLRHMFTMAIKWGRAEKNPVSDVKFLKEPKVKDRILSPEEETRLLAYVRTGHKCKHMEAIIITALNTGMRKGEILGLRWENVDFRAGCITVEKTKNGEIRKIPMNETLTTTLKNVRNPAQSSGYVFGESGNSEPAEKRRFLDVKRAWWHALKKAGIENFRFHDLRHTFGSRLGMAGVDIKTIQELMGHRDITMTSRYSHPTPEHKRKAVQILESSHTNFHTTPLEAQTGKVASA